MSTLRIRVQSNHVGSLEKYKLLESSTGQWSVIRAEVLCGLSM